MDAILQGLAYGLLLNILAGPILFTIMQVSVERGFWAGFSVAAGQWLGDILYIILVFLGANYVEGIMSDAETKANFIFYLGGIGGVMLILFGAVMFFTKSTDPEDVQVELKAGSYPAYFLRGFLINTVNPSPLFFWMSLMSFALAKEYTGGSTLSMFIVVISTVILGDILKIYLAKRLRKLLKPKYLLIIRRVAGIALVIFGVVLLLKSVAGF